MTGYLIEIPFLTINLTHQMLECYIGLLMGPKAIRVVIMQI